MTSRDKDVESDLPGFYYDRQKRKYFRITPGRASNPLPPEKIQRIKGHEQAEQIKEEIRKRNTMSFSSKYGSINRA